MKQNEEYKTQRNVAQYFKKYEDIFGSSEDLQNKESGPQLSLPLQDSLPLCYPNNFLLPSCFTHSSGVGT